MWVLLLRLSRASMVPDNLRGHSAALLCPMRRGWTDSEDKVRKEDCWQPSEWRLSASVFRSRACPLPPRRTPCPVPSLQRHSIPSPANNLTLPSSLSRSDSQTCGVPSVSPLELCSRLETAYAATNRCRWLSRIGSGGVESASQVFTKNVLYPTPEVSGGWQVVQSCRWLGNEPRRCTTPRSSRQLGLLPLRG